MAQMEYGTSEDVTQIRNFYVVVLMLAGMIDDLEECLQEIKRARDMPISIIIVKVGAQDEQDAHTLMQKTKDLNFERTFVHLIELDKFKHYSKVMPNHFGYELFKDIPAQIEKFFEVMRFDLDVTQQIAMTPLANKKIGFSPGAEFGSIFR